MAFSLINSGRRLIERVTPDNIINTGIGVLSGRADPVNQPQLAFMWEVLFRGMFASSAKNITFYAKNTAIPQVTTEAIRRYYNGVEYAYSGKDNTPRTLAITFWDNQDLEVYSYFRQWANSMNDSFTGRKVRPLNYKRDISLRLKDTSDLLINGEFIFHDAFPTEVGEVALSYDDSNVMEFTVLFYFSKTDSTGEVDSIINRGIDAAGNIISGVVSTAIEGIKRYF